MVKLFGAEIRGEGVAFEQIDAFEIYCVSS